MCEAPRRSRRRKHQAQGTIGNKYWEPGAQRVGGRQATRAVTTWRTAHQSATPPAGGVQVTYFNGYPRLTPRAIESITRLSGFPIPRAIGSPCIEPARAVPSLAQGVPVRAKQAQTRSPKPWEPSNINMGTPSAASGWQIEQAAISSL